jgi:hypothetical protein
MLYGSNHFKVHKVFSFNLDNRTIQANRSFVRPFYLQSFSACEQFVLVDAIYQTLSFYFENYTH